MAGTRELGLPRTTTSSVREQAAKVILRNVRSQGHAYIELRDNGKKLIFFCTLCLAPCYSDAVLFDHLKGNLHTERLAAAKVTLLGLNPWPFNDGVLFFTNSDENDKQLLITNCSQNKLQESDEIDNRIAIVEYVGTRNGGDGICTNKEITSAHHGKNMNGNGRDCHLMIPGVLVKDELSDLDVKFIGFGKIAARFCVKDEKNIGISRIWCEWLGKRDSSSDDVSKISEHDFAVITFSYSYNLGRKGLFDDVKLLLSSSPGSDCENDENRRKRKKPFSAQENSNESLSNQCASHSPYPSVSSGATSKLSLDGYDDQLLQTRLISSKTIRRELRRQQRIAAERMCDICQHKMLLGKDVACLVNIKTGKLACSSRNLNGAFHMYHTSCLIQWVLLCEFEMHTNQRGNAPKARRRSKRKSGANCSKIRKEDEATMDGKICCVFCPECQGTGVDINGDELEKPTVTLSKMFRYKVELSDARRAWMRSPEILENSTIGFHFPNENEGTVQKVSPLRLLHFYCADV